MQYDKDTRVKERWLNDWRVYAHIAPDNTPSSYRVEAGAARAVSQPKLTAILVYRVFIFSPADPC